MRSFRQFFRVNQPFGQSNSLGCSPFTSMSNTAVKGLILFAVFLTGLGVLVLLFPMILAFFVAGLFFLVAMGALSWAWKLYRVGRSAGKSNHYTHVTVEPSQNEQEFY